MPKDGEIDSSACKPKRKKRILFLLLYFVIVGTLMLIVLELAAGVILGKRIENSLSAFEGILQTEQNILEVSGHYDSEWKSREFSISVRTNSRGFREDFEFEDSSVDVAFMGDSFCFGHGVNVVDRYTNIAAAEHPNMTIVSLSYNNGFQPEHYEYFLDKHPEIRPTILFVGLYLGNDLDSDLTETVIERDEAGKIRKLELPYRDVYRGTIINRPRYRSVLLSNFVEVSNLGKLMAIRINSSHRLRNLFQKPDSIRPNTANRLSTEQGKLDPHSLRAIQSLKNIAQIVRMRNGELHVLLIPQNFLTGDVKNPHIAQENRPKAAELRSSNGLTKAVIQQCEAAGLQYHDLASVLTTDDYFVWDAHWTPAGHKKVGTYVSKVISESQESE